MLNSKNIHYKGKPLDYDIIYNQFSIPLLDLYINTYSDVLKIESQYIYSATGAGVNGLPNSCKYYLEFIGLFKNSYVIDQGDLSKEDFRRKRNRHNKFKNWKDNGWDGSNDTKENNKNILCWCLDQCYSLNEISYYLSKKQLNEAKEILNDKYINKFREVLND